MSGTGEPPIPWHPARHLHGRRLLTWDDPEMRRFPGSRPLDGELTGTDEQGRPWTISMEVTAPTYGAGARLAAVMALVGPIAFPSTVRRIPVDSWPVEIEVREHRSGDCLVLVPDHAEEDEDPAEVRILPPGRHLISRHALGSIMILCERSRP